MCADPSKPGRPLMATQASHWASWRSWGRCVKRCSPTRQATRPEAATGPQPAKQPYGSPRVGSASVRNRDGFSLELADLRMYTPGWQELRTFKWTGPVAAAATAPGDSGPCRGRLLALAGMSGVPWSRRRAARLFFLAPARRIPEPIISPKAAKISCRAQPLDDPGSLGV
jgi:hypothetical protein